MRAGITRFEQTDAFDATVSRLSTIPPSASRSDRMDAGATAFCFHRNRSRRQRCSSRCSRAVSRGGELSPPTWAQTDPIESALVYGVDDGGAMGACLVASPAEPFRRVEQTTDSPPTWFLRWGVAFHPGLGCDSERAIPFACALVVLSIGSGLAEDPMAARKPSYRTPKAEAQLGIFHPLWGQDPTPVGIGKITETLNYWFTLIVVLRIYEERAAPACC